VKTRYFSLYLMFIFAASGQAQGIFTAMDGMGHTFIELYSGSTKEAQEECERSTEAERRARIPGNLVFTHSCENAGSKWMASIRDVENGGELKIAPEFTPEQVILRIVRVWLESVKAQQQERDKKAVMVTNFEKTITSAHSAVVSPVLNSALTSAIVAWRKALGVERLSIRRPRLLSGEKGSCSGTGTPIACATKGDIVLDGIRDDAAIDYRTIFMHELGHLLGVPHIEGDQLMNESYLGKRLTPTPQAIAIAKLWSPVLKSVRK